MTTCESSKANTICKRCGARFAYMPGITCPRCGEQFCVSDCSACKAAGHCSMVSKEPPKRKAASEDA